MNSRRREILLIAVALTAILGAGFGLGNLLGGGKTPTPLAPPAVAVDTLEAETLSALRQALDLSPDQERAIRGDIARTTREVLETRRRALFEYHREMLRLHDQIAPKLDPAQQETLRKNRRKLQDTIEKRFPNLLNEPLTGSETDS